MDQIDHYIDSLFPEWDICLDRRSSQPIIKTTLDVDKYIQYFGEVPITYFLNISLDIKLTLISDKDKLQIYAMLDYDDKRAYNQNLDDYFETISTTEIAVKIANILSSVDTDEFIYPPYY